VAPPFRIAELDIHFGSGIDKVGCLVDLAETAKILDRKGSWYYYHSSQASSAEAQVSAVSSSSKNKEGEAIAQGRNGVISLLKSNAKLRAEIETHVKDYMQRVTRISNSNDSNGSNGGNGGDDDAEYNDYGGDGFEEASL
jgi:recombination protein RecA